jgi:hypothetical protein
MNIKSRMLLAMGIICLLAQPVYAQSSAPGSSMATAIPFGNNPTGEVRNSRVGATSPYRYFTFSLSESRASSIELTGLIANASLYMWGDNGTWAMSTNSGITNEAISQRLRPGNYTIFVYGWTADTNFQLSVDTAGPPTGRTEQLGLIDGTGTNTNRLVQGNVGANEGWVDYVFELPDTRSVTISAQIATGAAVSPLVSPQQWQVADQQGVITTEMPGGTHFVRLFGRPGLIIPFTLSISAAPQDFAGNSFATATSIGAVGDPPTALVDFVGQSDGEDYFVFNVAPGSIVNADLVHTSGSGADIYLFDSSETLLTASTNADDAYETLSYDSLVGGVYYLRVAIPPVNGLNAQYTLRIGKIPLPVSFPTGTPVNPNCPQGTGPDGNNCIDQPEFFSGGFLNQNSSIPSVQSNVGGINDPVDHYTLRVGCNSSAYRPTFNITSTGNVNVDLDKILPINGSRADQPFAQGFPISPLAAEDRPGNRVYEYRFTVTPLQFSIGGQQYSITATHTDCS